jgi:protein-S-isoprenylcysteine O-methyltransferase Ste14
MILSFEPSSLAFVLSVSGCLGLLAITPPNPPPPRSHLIEDRMRFTTRPTLTLFGRITLITYFLYHILLVLTFPNPPSLVCPHASRLDHRFFTWTFYSAACTVLAILGASVRLTAYKQLGPNFTFQLARPKKLVTTGLYKYVQHPAYPALIVVLFANLAVLARRRTAVACWVPMSWWISDDRMGFAVEAVIAVLYLLAMVYAMRLRVADEEKMLKEVFGKEWQEYNGRTKRYIPGVI